MRKKKIVENESISTKKIFVLDTSVILYDHNSYKKFEENDIVIPVTVLEELDNHKKGSEVKNAEARKFIRVADKITESNNTECWINNPETNGRILFYINKLNKSGEIRINGKVEIDSVYQVFNDESADIKNDHKILQCALEMKQTYPECDIILVTKDINLKVKARLLDIIAEDYKNDKVEVDSLFTGIDDLILPEKTYSSLLKDKRINIDLKVNSNIYYRVKLNEKDENYLKCYYNFTENVLKMIDIKYVANIRPRNEEQEFALHALLNDDISLVTIQSKAGTGKTLLSLAAAIEQRNKFEETKLTRSIIAMADKDLGFLPGDVKDKIAPYMQGYYDNLKFLLKQGEKKSANKKPKFKKDEVVESDENKLKKFITDNNLSLEATAYIRGRSFNDILFIIDESQNLTKLEIKTIITRAGEGSKFIFLGDIEQIDVNYLDRESNGLSYLIDRFKNQPMYAHITLNKCERSELAQVAADIL